MDTRKNHTVLIYEILTPPLGTLRRSSREAKNKSNSYANFALPPYGRAFFLIFPRTVDLFTRTTMYEPKQLKLSGHNYNERHKKIPSEAKKNANHFRRLNQALEPHMWVDKLTHKQEALYHYVEDNDSWAAVRDKLAKDVSIVPAVSIGIVPGRERPEFLSVSTFTGQTAVLSLTRLTQTLSGWFREEDLLPEDLKVWLREPEFYVICSGLSNFFRSPPDGFQATNIIDTELVFGLYQSTGIIRPNIVPKVGDVAYQMCLPYGYHSYPSTVQTFEGLVGENHYVEWPLHRSPGWLPILRPSGQKPEEKFYCFYLSVAPLTFLHHIMHHGIIYDGVQAVQKELPFNELYKVFLRGKHDPGGTTLPDPDRKDAGEGKRDVGQGEVGRAR